MKGELMQTARRETEKADRLRKAAARQIATGERTAFEMEVGGDYVTITDKRLVITKLGSVLSALVGCLPSYNGAN